MGHPDQHTPDSHDTSNRKDAPEPNVSESIKEDLSPEARRELEERAETGASVRNTETEGAQTGEAGHTYVGRQMDDRLKANPRERDRDKAVEEDEETGEDQ